jgi:hypothetical protein
MWCLQVWWHFFVIPQIWRLRQEDHKIKAGLGYRKIVWLEYYSVIKRMKSVICYKIGGSGDLK